MEKGSLRGGARFVTAERIKRYHKKSRTGCKACRQRRVRCDERVPICSCCLVRGYDCVYGYASALPHVLAATPEDPFGTLPIPMVGRMSEDYYETITHHRFLVSTLGIPPKSSSPDLGLANANPEWFRYSLIQNLSKHLLVARNNLQTLPPDFERTFLTHQLAVLRMIKDEIAKGVFTFTALGVMSALALCKMAAGNDEEAIVHFRGVGAIWSQPSQASVSHIGEFRTAINGICIASQVQLLIARWAKDESTRWKVDGVTALCRHPSHKKALTNRLVACYSWQLVSMFASGIGLRGHIEVRGRGDAQVIRWLHGRLVRLRASARHPDDIAGAKGRSRADEEVSDETCLELAIMSLYVVVGSLYAPTGILVNGAEKAANPLSKLRRGYEKLLAEQALTGTILTDKLVRDYVGLMMWFETDEGLEGLRRLADALDLEVDMDL